MLLREPQPAYPSNLRAWMPSASVDRVAAVVLAALFLPGGPRGFAPPRRRWPEMLHALRAEGASMASCGWALRRWGFTEESLVLESPGLLAWAEARIEMGEVLTAACSRYPSGWLRKLGAAAPPALWTRGTMPEGPFLAVVGSRSVGASVRQFAREVGEAAVRLGYSVVSGAAPGCDRAAAAGASKGRRTIDGEVEETKNEKRKTKENDQHSPPDGQRRSAHDPDNPKSKIPNPKSTAPLVEVLPCGLDLRREPFAGAVLSPFAPEEPFSGPSAMIRNALIYAMAEVAVVVHARFGEGGTWRGATEAHRRRLCRLIVHPGFDPASRRAALALAALGAQPLSLDSEAVRALAEALAKAKTPSESTLPF